MSAVGQGVTLEGVVGLQLGGGRFQVRVVVDLVGVEVVQIAAGTGEHDVRGRGELGGGQFHGERERDRADVGGMAVQPQQTDALQVDEDRVALFCLAEANQRGVGRGDVGCFVLVQQSGAARRAPPHHRIALAFGERRHRGGGGGQVEFHAAWGDTHRLDLGQRAPRFAAVSRQGAQRTVGQRGAGDVGRRAQLLLEVGNGAGGHGDTPLGTPPALLPGPAGGQHGEDRGRQDASCCRDCPHARCLGARVVLRAGRGRGFGRVRRRCCRVGLRGLVRRRCLRGRRLRPVRRLASALIVRLAVVLLFPAAVVARRLVLRAAGVVLRALVLLLVAAVVLRGGRVGRVVRGSIG